MLKILFVAVFKESSTNYEQANCLEELGHEVIRYDYRAELSNKTVEKRDGHLIELCKTLIPDLVIFSKCNVMHYRVVEECNKVSTTCLWYMDPLNSSWNAELLQKINLASYCVMDKKATFEECQKHSDNVYFVTDGYDPKVDTPHNVSKSIDVGFIGMLYDTKRRMHLKELKKLYGINVQVINGVFREEHAKTVSSIKINLNFCTTSTVSNRVYKIMAAGGFLMTDPWYGLEDRFEPGKDLVVFNNTNDLAEKVKYYLENEDERQQIADNGRKTIAPYSKLGWAKKIIEAYNDTLS